MEGNFPAWEIELRALVLRAIKEQVVANMAKPEWHGMWPRSGSGFAETQAKKFLSEAWMIFPAWKRTYEAIDKITLSETWDTLFPEAKMQIAVAFKDHFYKVNGLPNG